MRRIIGLVLVGLGVFALVAVPMLRFYAYPKLAVARIDQDSVSTLIGQDATVFDVRSLAEITTDLKTTVQTVGDIEASLKARDGVRVWVSTSSTRDSEGIVRSRSVQRVAFDATTGEAVNCCGEFYEAVENSPEEIKHKGLVFKFPFDTQKKTYEFWDSTLRQAVPIDYKGVSEVDGVTVYVFRHAIEPTATSTQNVPASLLGVDAEGIVSAERMYSNVRTLWVEPNTGVILNRSEQQNNTIRYEGEDRITTTRVVTGYDDATIKANADKYGQLGSLLNLVRNLLPVVLLVIGPLLILLGLRLARRRPFAARLSAVLEEMARSSQTTRSSPT